MSNADVLKLLPTSWDLPPEVRTRVGTRVGRQRVILEQGHLILVLHQVPQDGSRERKAAVFWRKPEGEWRASPGKDSFAALREHVRSFDMVLEKLDDRTESARTSSDYFEILRITRPISRSVKNLGAVLGMARDSVAKDICEQEPEFAAMRDRVYELERLSETILSEAEAGMQYLIAQHTEEQAILSEHIARETHRLNMLVALFLPTTALGAVFGMNVVSGLEEWNKPYAFWGVVAAGLVIGVVFRRVVKVRG